ncbi:MAG: biotin--[acetyl-CoA-carboxylase] ligase [Pseudomonadota bacterium]
MNPHFDFPRNKDGFPERPDGAPNTAFLGRGANEHHQTIDSTNLRAKELARSGAPEGTLVTAEAQTSGRGRLGRAWHSPPGRNLYFSLVLRPNISPERLPILTLAAGLGVAEALRDITGLGLEIKWPNDILINKMKVVGILSEMEMLGAGVSFVVLGIGINVNLEQGDLPEELAPLAASLLIASGRPWDRVEILAGVLSGVEHNYLEIIQGRPQGVLARYRRACATIGSKVRLADGVQILEGLAVDIDENGALVVELSGDGSLLTVSAGEVTLVKE